MSNNVITPLSSTLGLVSGLVNLRDQAVDLQRQLATGRISDTYGGLGADRSIVLSTRAITARLEAYQSSTTDVGFRLELTQLTLRRMQSLSTDAKAQVRGAGFDLDDMGQTTAQTFAKATLGEALSLLNTEVAGRSIFAGRAVDGAAVVSPSVLLDGDGAGKAGFKTVMNQRRVADSALDNLGRTAITAPAADTVRLAEDGAHPFGLKLSEVTTTSASVTLTTSITAGTATADSVDVQFTGVPLPNDVVRIAFALPDGTNAAIELRATADGAQPGTFAIGADANATAANFQAALATQVEELVRTDMTAASAIAASANFFDEPPLRLDNTANPEAATALVADTTYATTVDWYLGESSSNPRDTAQTFIGRNRKVAYGAQANEAPFKEILKSLAVMASTTFENTQTGRANYEATTTRVTSGMSFSGGQKSLNSIIAEMASLQAFVGQSKDFNDAEMNLAEELLADREQADMNEVAVKLSSIQVHLQAAYSATSIVSQLTLVNYLEGEPEFQSRS